MRAILWSAGILACAGVSACEPKENPGAPAPATSVRTSTTSSMPDRREAIRHGSREERIAAARSFPCWGSDLEDAVPFCVESLKDEDPEVVDALRSALELLRPPPRSSVTRLRCALRENFAAVRLGAAEALAQMGSGAEEAVPELIGSLADRDCSVRVVALEALVRVGHKAVPPLLEALAEHEPGLGLPIAHALARILPDGLDALESIGDFALEQLISREN